MSTPSRLAVRLCAVVAALSDGSVRAQSETIPVELSTVGLDGRTGTPIVVLRDPESGGVLPIWVGVMEAQAIALALHGVVPPRPMTHDLMASLPSGHGADFVGLHRRRAKPDAARRASRDPAGELPGANRGARFRQDRR
jgi:hypothetical protein